MHERHKIVGGTMQHRSLLMMVNKVLVVHYQGFGNTVSKPIARRTLQEECELPFRHGSKISPCFLLLLLLDR